LSILKDTFQNCRILFQFSNISYVPKYPLSLLNAGIIY